MKNELVMKNINMYKLQFLTVLTGLMVIISCRKMDTGYKDFLVLGGKVYPGKALNAKAHGGNNRIKISWPRGVDPNLTKAVIFWNNYADSVVVPIAADVADVSYTFENLEERIYTYTIRTYDDKGNASVPVELTGRSYGRKYETSLLNRSVNSAQNEANGDVSIHWGPVDPSAGLYAMDVQYRNNVDQLVTKRFSTDDLVSILADYKRNTTFKYRSMYLPDTLAIDTFFTAYEEKAVDLMRKFDKTGWLAEADATETTNQVLYGPAKIIDNNITTFWHSPWTQVRPFPHWVSVDMKKNYTVTEVELTCRQGNRLGITKFTIQGRLEGQSWTDYGSFTLLQQDAPQRFTVEGYPEVRHIRIYATAGMDSPTHLAELSVFGY